MTVGDGYVGRVSSFVYLGCVIKSDSRAHHDVLRRIAKVANAFGALLHVFRDASLSLNTSFSVTTAHASFAVRKIYCSSAFGAMDARLDFGSPSGSGVALLAVMHSSTVKFGV